MIDRLRPHQHRVLNTVLQGHGGFSAWSRFAALASSGHVVFGSSVLDACIRQSVLVIHKQNQEEQWKSWARSAGSVVQLQRLDPESVVLAEPLTADTGLEYTVEFKRIPMPQLPRFLAPEQTTSTDPEEPEEPE